MSKDDVEKLANSLRVTIQSRTCCPGHAVDVLFVVLASFALDGTVDNPSVAAENIRRLSSTLAAQVQQGRYKLERSH